MNFDHLNDTEFLYALDNMKVRHVFVRIVLLTFDEHPIREIEGKVTSGQISVNANSRVRRTLTLGMVAEKRTNDLTDINNLISINKKIKVFIGLRNPFLQYKKYGDIVWFKGGVYVISTANISSTTSGCTINITAKDKMVMLDGTVGGTLPASTTFHETELKNADGTVTKYKPPIYEIIQETVNHFGGERLDNIIISDLNKEAKMQVKYINNKPIYFNDRYSAFQFAPKFGFEANKFTQGQDVGYEMTAFTYPSELIHEAGSNVMKVLDDICKVLTNHEYFYDIDGRFVFQEIKNYLNTSYTPLYDMTAEGYIKTMFSDTKYKYSITNGEATTNYTVNPKYDSIKNDFIVWGQRKAGKDTEVGIRYHLVIDEKPQLSLCLEPMWAVFEESIEGDPTFVEAKRKYTVKEYRFGEREPMNSRLVGGKCNEWREELYRQALLKQLYGTSEVSYSDGMYVDKETGRIVKGNIASYDEELLAEWRNLYDPTREDWRQRWKELYDDQDWSGWNPAVRSSPGTLNYWLDFIDTTKLAKYSVNQIGCRTKVINDTKIKTIYNMEVPDVVFFENPEDTEELHKLIAHYNKMGQAFCILWNDSLKDYFTISTSSQSCFDKIRNLLYQAISYNTNITITCFPKYYLEPNNLIYVKDEKSGIHGNYVITQFTIPLTYNGTMSITATEALTQT